MAKVMTFSRTFPSYHPKAGQPTYFVEKFWRSLPIPCGFPNIDASVKGILDFTKEPDMVKCHTIRSGHHWKVGDWYQPVFWGDDVNPKSGRKGPYQSKMIKFAPLIQIKKLWDLDIEGSDWFLNGKRESPIIGEGFNSELLAANDGLSGDDLYDWFVSSPDFKKKNLFSGQIICHTENIEY
jgi:hypothetical protein